MGNWNTDDADWTDFHEFFPEKSVKIRPIRVIRVPIRY